MVICRQRNADLHMAQLMPLPLNVSCFNKIQIGFTFKVTQVAQEKGPLNGHMYVLLCTVLCRNRGSGILCIAGMIIRSRYF